MTFDLSRKCNINGQLRIITKKELAVIIGRDERTIHRLVEEKRIPEPMRTKRGYNGGWPSSTINEWLKSNKGR